MSERSSQNRLLPPKSAIFILISRQTPNAIVHHHYVCASVRSQIFQWNGGMGRPISALLSRHNSGPKRLHQTTFIRLITRAHCTTYSMLYPQVKYGVRSIYKVYLGSISRDVHSCSHWLRPRNTPSPRIQAYVRGALLNGHLRQTSPSNPLVVPILFSNIKTR